MAHPPGGNDAGGADRARLADGIVRTGREPAPLLAVVAIGAGLVYLLASAQCPVVRWRDLARRGSRRGPAAAPRFGWVARPPRTVGDLADALGVAVEAPGGLTSFFSSALARGGLVTGQFAWDMYHEAPVSSADRLRGRSLVSYTVSYPEGRTACAAALSRSYGPPARAGSRLRYGPFFVQGNDGEGFTVEWHEEEPERALPAADQAQRARVLRDLAAAVAAATDESRLAAALAAAASAGPGLEAGRTGELVFRPPVPALLLAEAIGIPQPTAMTVDVHRSSWVLAVVSDGRLVRPRAGPWRIEARLAGSRTEGALSERDAVRAMSFDRIAGP